VSTCDRVSALDSLSIVALTRSVGYPFSLVVRQLMRLLVRSA